MNRTEINRIREIAERDGAAIAVADRQYGNSLTQRELRAAAEVQAERAEDLRFADEPNAYNRIPGLDLAAVPFQAFERYYVPAWMRGYREAR